MQSTTFLRESISKICICARSDVVAAQAVKTYMARREADVDPACVSCGLREVRGAVHSFG